MSKQLKGFEKGLPELSKNFGKRLEFVRKKIAENLTQENFCKKVGIPEKQYLSAYESGKVRPPWETLISISKRYNITLDWLLQGMGSPYKEPTLDRRLHVIDRLVSTIMDEKGKSYLYHNFSLIGQICKDAQTPVEIRRRVTEFIPKLYIANPELTVPILLTLRDDYDDKWLKSDIRRRVVEAIDAINLLDKNLELAMQLLYYRERDEVFTLIATTEALYWYRSRNPDTKGVADDILASFPKELKEDIPDFLFNLLQWFDCKPTAEELQKRIKELTKDTLKLICLVRNLHRAFGEDKVNNYKIVKLCIEILDTFKEENQKNIRRPVVRHLSRVLELAKKEDIDMHSASLLVTKLAEDSDTLIKRTITDFYEELLDFPELALTVYETLINSDDPLIWHRTERMFESLLGSEGCYKAITRSSEFRKRLENTVISIIRKTEVNLP